MRNKLFPIILVISIMFSFSVASMPYEDIGDKLDKYDLEKQRLESEGFTTIRLSSNLDISRNFLNQNNINESLRYLEESKRIIDQIKQADERMGVLKEDIQKIEEIGIDINVSHIKTYEEEFRIENYEGALFSIEELERSLRADLTEDIDKSLKILSDDSSRFSTTIINNIRSDSRNIIYSLDVENYGLLKEKIEFYLDQFQVLNEVDYTINDLRSNNLSPSVFEDLRSSMIVSINKDDTQEIIRLTSSYDELYETYSKSKESLQEIKSSIERYKSKGYDVSQFDQDIEKAEKEYLLGNYVLAYSRLSQLENDLEEFESKQVFRNSISEGRFSVKQFLLDHKGKIVSFLLIILLLFLFFFRYIKDSILKRRYYNLKDEKRHTQKMIMNLQKNYYGNKKMSKEEYDFLSEKHQDKLMQITKKMHFIEKIKKKGSA